jgi:ADP-heptose:LPS heptosyltransferase
MVSTDSGPYHMAVALKVPTLAWFIKEEEASYHQVAWCKHVVHPTADEFVELSLSLLKPLA